MMGRRSVLLGSIVGALTTVGAPALAAPRRKSGMELREVFAGVRDGVAPSTATVTGQPMVNFPGTGAGTPWVRNGMLTARYPQQFEGGSYRIVQLDGPVREIGAYFALTPHTIPGGVMCLSIQLGNIATTSPAVPVSPMHLWVDKFGWNLDVNTEAGTPVDTVASGSFLAPLNDDGVTIHGVGVLLERELERCTLWLPDGQVLTMYDSRFNRGGRWAYVEPFKTPDDSGLKSAALIREWWARA